jgi:hypothetical protein
MGIPSGTSVKSERSDLRLPGRYSDKPARSNRVNRPIRAKRRIRGTKESYNFMEVPQCFSPGELKNPPKGAIWFYLPSAIIHRNLTFQIFLNWAFEQQPVKI